LLYLANHESGVNPATIMAYESSLLDERPVKLTAATPTAPETPACFSTADVSARPLQDQGHREFVNRPFQFGVTRKDILEAIGKFDAGTRHDFAENLRAGR
jgi:hypothetical protein